MKRASVACLSAVVLLAACGGSTSTASSTGSSPSAAAGSHVPTGPPTATGSTQGDANVAGNVTFNSVTCSSPRVDGPAIGVSGKSPGAVSLVITIQAQKVVVRAATGSGATYAQREFTGTGVSGFDAAKGARVDSTLDEIAASAANPATIGRVASIKMTVDCANQQPGTASVTVTGTARSGALSGPLTSVRVDCHTPAEGGSVGVTGLILMAGQPTLIIISVYSGGITAAVDGRFYTNLDPAAGTATATTGHWNGDVTEKASGTKLHISGDATCGSSTAT